MFGLLHAHVNGHRESASEFRFRHAGLTIRVEPSDVLCHVYVNFVVRYRKISQLSLVTTSQRGHTLRSRWHRRPLKDGFTVWTL
jgi:hypothetical protein